MPFTRITATLRDTQPGALWIILSGDLDTSKDGEIYLLMKTVILHARNNIFNLFSFGDLFSIFYFETKFHELYFNMTYSVISLVARLIVNLIHRLLFGLYAVDMNDPQRTRTPKASAIYYKKVIETRRVDHEYEPTSTLNKLEL